MIHCAHCADRRIILVFREGRYVTDRCPHCTQDKGIQNWSRDHKRLMPQKEAKRG